MIIINKELRNWNQLVRKYDYAGIQQTTFWARYMQKYCYAKPMYISVYKDADVDQENPVAIMLCFKKCYGAEYLVNYKLLKPLIPIIGKILPTIFCQKAPIFLDDTVSKKDVMSEIIKYFSNYKIYCELNDEIEMELDNNVWGTYIVELNHPIDQLFSRINKSARKNIKNAESIGYRTIVGSDDCVLMDDYNNVLRETRKRLKLQMPPHYPNSVMIKELMDRVQMFVVYDDNKRNHIPLACMGVVCYNKLIMEIGSGTSDYSCDNNINVGDLLKWEIIKWGHDRGYDYYDLGGVNPLCDDIPIESKDYNIYKFKKKFGGKLKVYSVINRGWFGGYYDRNKI